MKTQSTKNKLRYVSAMIVGVFFLAVRVQATILTFWIDNSGNNTSMQTVHPNYGDSVNSLTQTDGAFTDHYLQGNAFTPSINLSYSQSTGSQNYYHDTHWGDQVNTPNGVDYLSSVTLPATFYFTFTPNTPGVGVDVNSFRLFRYNAPSTENVTWSLHQDTSSGTVFDSGSVAVTGTFDANNSIPANGSNIAPTINTAGQVYYGAVVLEIDHLTGDGGSLGLDDINFDQVPEPSTILLIGVGGALLWRRWTKRAQLV